MPQLQEGKTGKLPDGTPVIVRNGQVVKLTQTLQANSPTGRNEIAGLTGAGGAPQNAPGAGYFGMAGARPKMFAKTEEDLLKLDASAKDAQGREADAARFLALNKQKGTGFLPGMFGGAPAAAFSPRYAEMRAITEKMTPQMREAGSGAMSDRDVQMYRTSTMSLDKPGPTNAALSKAMQAGAQREQDYNAFRNEWARRNNTLVGSQEAWQAYADSNPLFGTGGDGLTSVNQTKPWREWFGLASPQQRPATPPRPVTAGYQGGRAGAGASAVGGAASSLSDDDIKRQLGL